MPRRRVHLRTGTLTGATAAALQAQSATPLELLAELLGGGLGGRVGGLLPDTLEPGTSSYHRKIAHSWTALGSLTLVHASEMQAVCRQKAADAQLRAAAPGVGPQADLLKLQAFLWHFLAGAIAGLIAGYASHLVLDASSSRGLPLLG